LKHSCWITLIMLINTTAVYAHDLTIVTEKKKYWRYELVKIIASQTSTPAASAVNLPDMFYATVWRGKRKVTTVGKMKRVRLFRQTTATWEGYWPIPFNPVLGKYTVKTRVFTADGTTLTAAADFVIQGRAPYQLPPGFSVVTYEGGKKGPNRTPSLTPGEPNSWRNLIQWADYMGADAFWHCVGQTQVWGRLKEEQYPFSEYTVRLMKRVGAEVHAVGIKYGAWITAFVVIGDKPEATGYTFTLGYDCKQNALRQLRYVSLGCQKRIRHIIELLKKFEADPNVDYLGLDYMRTDVGGYEFADQFVRDMSISVPPEWSQWSASEHSLWLARLIEVQRNSAVREQWQWWRAHKVGLIIEQILSEVSPTKPVWVFSLGWKTGHQHGQDVLMMLDAGIGFNAPMFYSIDKPDFPYMLNSWKRYLQRADASVVIGECVDWNLLGRTRDPAGPQEHLDRQIETMERLMPATKSFGFFWHDLARAFFGARGPYGTREWVIAGAASFSRLKAKAKRLSFKLELDPPLEIILHRETELKVKITNTTGNTLTAVAVELVPLPRLIRLDETPRVIHDLGPQNGTQTVCLRLRTDQVYEKNGGWQMVAVKAVCPADGENNAWFDFVYLPVTTELGPPLPQGNTPEAIAVTGNSLAGRKIYLPSEKDGFMAPLRMAGETGKK